MTAAEVAEFESVAGDLLAGLGYEVAGVPASTGEKVE